MKISVILEALTGTFVTDMDRASKSSKKAAEQMRKDFEAAGKAVGASLAVGIGAAGTALIAWTKQTVESARQIERFAQIANTSTGTFQRWAAGARQAGIEQEKLADILKDVQDKVGDFLQTGGGPLADFFENIAPAVGVTAEQFRRLSGPEALQLYVSSLEKANLSQSEMAFFMEAIASDATALLPLLRDNGKSMKAFGDEAERLGAVLSDDVIAQTKEVQRITREMDAQWTAFKTNVVTELLPTITDLAETINSPAFREGFGAIVTGAVNATAKVAELVAELGQLASFAGAEIAARVAGPAADDIVRLEQAIERQQRLLDQLDQRGTGAERTNTSDLANETRAELARLKQALDEARKAQDAAAAAANKHGKALGDQASASQDSAQAENDRGRVTGVVTELDRRAAEAAAELARVQQDHAETMRELFGRTGDLAAAQMEYASSVAAALRVAEEQRQAGLDEDSVRRQLIATIADAQRVLSEETDEIQRNADERARAADVVGNTLAQLEEEARTVNLSARERTVHNLILEAEARARELVNAGQRESIALSAEEIAAIRARADAAMNTIDSSIQLREAQEAAEAAAAEYQRAWTGAVDRVATAFGDWIAGGIKSFSDFRRAVVNIARQTLADVIALFLRNKIMVNFGVGGMGGIGGPAMAGGMPGFGIPGMGGGGIGGLFSGISNAISTGFGNVLSSVGGFFSQGAAFQGAGLMGSLGNFGSGLGMAGANVSGMGFFGSMGANLSGGFSALGSGAIAQGLGQIIPVIGQIYAIAKLIDTISGGKLFGTSFKPESSTTTLGLGADGGEASAMTREVRQRSLFRGRTWRNRATDPSDEAIEAAQSLFEAVRSVMAGAAQAMQAEAPEMIDAALRTVQEFDKNGKLKATRYFVDVLGRTWEEASAEAATTRITAEALIATIDAALGTTVQAASEAAGGAIGDVIDGMSDKIDDAAGSITPPFDTMVKSIAAAAGEASAIAERWRGDAGALMDGAQLLLAAATDIRRGAGLLGDGSLTDVVALIEDMAAEGEALAATYARVSAATGLLQQALDLSGVTLDKTREEFVRFAADIAEAAGGIDRAAALWSGYFDTFFSQEERLTLALARAQESAARQFADIGLDAADFAGEGGPAAFRELFESLLPTLSAEAIVQWLEAAEALGIVIDVSAELARISGTVAEEIDEVSTALADFMAEVDAEIASLTGPQTMAERIQAVIAETDALIARAMELGATEEQIARVRELSALRLGEIMEEQAAAFAAYQDQVQGLRDELADLRGLSEFQQEMRAIRRWTTDATESLNEAARAAGLQAAAEEDLALVHEIAAERAAAAIRRLMDAGRSIVDRLRSIGGTAAASLATGAGSTWMAPVMVAMGDAGASVTTLADGLLTLADDALAVDDITRDWIETTLNGMRTIQSESEETYRAQISAQERIQDWLDNLLLGDLGGLRPRDALAQAQMQFDELLQRALGGDAEAMAALPALADQILRLGRQVFASGEPYFDLRDQIAEALRQVAAIQFVAPPVAPTEPGGGMGGGGDPGAGAVPPEDLQQIIAERRELALELVAIIRDLVQATGDPLTEIGQQLGITMTELVDALGINLGELTVETAGQLADIASRMGVELTDLAQSVGVDLGSLADRQSLLNDALEQVIAGLPEGQASELEPMLRAVEDAAALGDTEGVEDGIAAMELAIQAMAPAIREQLAPFFRSIEPPDPATELDHLAGIRSSGESSLMELQSQTLYLSQIAAALTGPPAPGAGVPSFDVGTGYVPRDGLAMIHRGEAVLPATVADFFRREGIPIQPQPIPAAKMAAARDDRILVGAVQAGAADTVRAIGELTRRLERLEATTRETSERQTRALDRQTDALRTR